MEVVGDTNLGSDVDQEIPLSEQRRTEQCQCWAIFCDREQELTLEIELNFLITWNPIKTTAFKKANPFPAGLQLIPQYPNH